MLRKFAFAAVVSAAFSGGAETLGFWDFRDGAPGSDVTTVANSSGTGSFTSDTAKKTNGSTGVLPKFSADSPGQLRDGLNGAVLCANPQSIDFRYVSRSDRQGGYIDLTGVADAISGKCSFTIEYFVKQNADYSYYETGDDTWDQISKTMLYLESRTGQGAFKQVMPTDCDKTTKHAKGIKLEFYPHAVASSILSQGGDLCDGAWHHLAIVYAETNATAKTGQITLYWDHKKVDSTVYLNDPEGSTDLKLRIGTGYKTDKGVDKTTTEPVNASISALRVSNASLDPDAFLHEANPDYDMASSGTVALLTFAGGTTGESAASVAYDATDLAILESNAGTGVQLNGNDTGRIPAYDDDIPGRILFASSARDTVLATDYKSLKFTSAGEGTSTADRYQGVGGGCVNFPLLGTAISYQRSYTIEMFVKDEDWSQWQWESGLFYFDTKTNGVAFHNQCNVSTVKDGQTSGYVNMQGKSQANKSSTWRDGLWHHVALVFDGETGRQTIYLDYAAGTTVAHENGFWDAQRFVLGCRDNNPSYSWHGKITGVRIVPRALAVGDFMVATDYRLPAGTVFAVSFNDGAGKAGETFVSGVGKTTSAQAINQVGRKESLVVRYGLHDAAFPQYAEGRAVRAGRGILWGGESVWTNLAACHFLGYASLAADASLRQYAGTELCVPGSTDPARNPASWTMEAFVRPEYESQDNALLFAKAAVANQHASPMPYPKFCWMLARNKDGRLKLCWTEQAADPAYSYTSASTEYDRSVLTDAAVMKEHRWHHVALSYDKPAKTFRLYVDSRLVLTQATSGLELFDSTHDYFFSRIAASNGFEGWMDEIRFSDSALEPAAFESFERRGFTVLAK